MGTPFPPHTNPNPNRAPQANASAMVSNRLGLLLDDEADLPDFEAAAGRLRALLPGIDTDRFAEAFPAVLDIGDFERALEVGGGRMDGGEGRGEWERAAQAGISMLPLIINHRPRQDANFLMPGMDVPAMLRSNPGAFRLHCSDRPSHMLFITPGSL
jgi:hypothetical protein